MLKSLHVRNYVLIDSLDVDFPEGLIIITGQTGAGKSILLGALSLLTGSKADAAVIPEGADSCVVEAEFELQGEEAKSLLDENEVEWDNGHLIIRRVVNSSGRSRSFINDSPVQVGVLSALSSYLIDIHSQHQSLLLTDRQFQLSMLDHFAGNADLLEQCRNQYFEVKAIQLDLELLEQRLKRILSEKDYNEAQFRQLEASKLREGELEELEMEQKQLANAEEIKSYLCGIDEMNLPASLKEAGRMLDKLSSFIPEFEGVASRFESARIEIGDIVDEVVSANERIDVSQERLESVEERMSQLYALLKKHNCNSVGELISLRNTLSDALYDSSAVEEKVADLKCRLINARNVLDETASKLHDSRLSALPSFSASIQNSIRNLELENAVFKVQLCNVEMGPSGSDSVVFAFSASGKSPIDVAKCASGGEISRIMLCLKRMMARYTNMPTMIFDEIDTGVSGSVADKMGSMICDMGNDMQVFAITHLPQVAAKGQAHYLVSKGLGSVSTIRKLSEQERILEVARMLSGSSVTDAAIDNAKSLLGV